MAPLCKGSSAGRRWGIVTLPIHRLALVRLQSLRHGLRRATRLRVGPLCRCATSPHTVGSHPLHKGGFVLAQPYWLIAYKKMDVGGGVPDAPGNFALLPNVRFIVGADSISARATLCNHAYPHGASALGGQSDGRQPAKLARSCGSMPHWGIDRCATPQRRPLRPTCKLASTRCGPMQASAPTE